VLILDAKDSFSKQSLFEEAWAELYPGLIERVPLSKGGSVSSVDPATLTVKTDFEDYKAAGRQHRAAAARRAIRRRRRRRPHRLVPGRAGRFRIHPAARHPLCWAMRR
jgi:hypothetical protein